MNIQIKRDTSYTYSHKLNNITVGLTFVDDYGKLKCHDQFSFTNNDKEDGVCSFNVKKFKPTK